MTVATFLDWSMRDPRALAIVAVLWALILGPSVVGAVRGERAYRRRKAAKKEKGETR
jgi:hypothetical protein